MSHLIKVYVVLQIQLLSSLVDLLFYSKSYFERLTKPLILTL